MAGHGALTEALALLREPSRRHLLRQEQLPGDIGRLLGLLGGNPARLEAAARETGTGTGELLEAARFYVQEVMLYPSADARRVLGLNPGDGVDEAKAHYRMLQAWLHPDRAQGAAEAVFATRVNAAWAHCRGSATGEAPGARSDANAPLREMAAPGQPRWRRLEVAQDWWSFRGLFPVFLLVTCAVLLWAATRPTPAPVLPEPQLMPIDTGAMERLDMGAPADGVQGAAAVETQAVVAPAAVPAPEAMQVPSAPTPRGVALVAPEQQGGTRGPSQPSSPPARQAPSRSLQAREPPTADAAAERMPETVQATAEPEPATASPAMPIVADTDGARRRAEILLEFLIRKGEPSPPIWRNAGALESAESARLVLTQGALFRRPRIVEKGVRWTFGKEQAHVRVPVIPADREAAPRVVHAVLHWQDDQWWVDQVSLEEPS